MGPHSLKGVVVKKVSRHKLRLVLNKDIIRTLDTRDLTGAGGGGGGDSERSFAPSGCPACADPAKNPAQTTIVEILP
jgi:hypothetical protein